MQMKIPGREMEKIFAMVPACKMGCCATIVRKLKSKSSELKSFWSVSMLHAQSKESISHL